MEVPEPVRAPGSITVAGTMAEPLWHTLRHAYEALGFSALADDDFEALVFAQLIRPDLAWSPGLEHLDELGLPSPSSAAFEQLLDRLSTGGYHQQLAQACQAHSAARTGPSPTFIYLAKLRFSTTLEYDWLAPYRRHRRPGPQLIMAVELDRNGFPLNLHPIPDDRSVAESLLQLQANRQHDGDNHLNGVGFSGGVSFGDRPIIVADASCLRVSWLPALDEAEVSFVLGSRTGRGPGRMAAGFDYTGTAPVDGQVIEVVDTYRQIWVYSQGRAQRDRATIARQERRAQAVVTTQQISRLPRFVRQVGDHLELDEAGLGHARGLAGFRGYLTNTDPAVLPGDTAAGIYHDLWHVEQALQLAHDDLDRARRDDIDSGTEVHTGTYSEGNSPSWTEEAEPWEAFDSIQAMDDDDPEGPAEPIPARSLDEVLQAQMSIGLATLAMRRYIEAATGVRLAEVISTLKPLVAVTLRWGDQYHRVASEIPPDAARLIRAITSYGDAGR